VPSRATLNKRLAVDRQQLLILLIAAVMAGSFFLLVLWPKQRELASLLSEVSRQRDLVHQKVVTSQEGVYVSARVSSLRKAQARLAEWLPEEPRLAEFLHAVTERVQAEPGVAHEIERLDGEAPGTRDPARQVAVLGAGKLPCRVPAPAVPLLLRLTGPFEGVHRCLAGIERLERLNRVQRVHFRRADDHGQVVAEAEVLVYYLSPEALPGPGAARQAGDAASDEVARG
jgi:hypothetical protein